MKDFNLKLQDIYKILRECHALGVSEFTFKDMHFKFHPRNNVAGVHPDQGAQELDTNTVVFPGAEKEIAQFNQQAQDDAEEMQLMVDDPATFEREQVDRFLEKARMNGKTEFRPTEPRI